MLLSKDASELLRGKWPECIWELLRPVLPKTTTRCVPSWPSPRKNTPPESVDAYGGQPRHQNGASFESRFELANCKHEAGKHERLRGERRMGVSIIAQRGAPCDMFAPGGKEEASLW